VTVNGNGLAAGRERPEMPLPYGLGSGRLQEGVTLRRSTALLVPAAALTSLSIFLRVSGPMLMVLTVILSPVSANCLTGAASPLSASEDHSRSMEL